MDVNENGIEMDSELGKELQEVSVEKESRYKDFDARYKCSFNLYIFYFNFDLSVKHVFVLTRVSKMAYFSICIFSICISTLSLCI